MTSYVSSTINVILTIDSIPTINVISIINDISTIHVIPN